MPLVRDELAAVAVQLIARQGFEATTVDQIVVDAGVSPEETPKMSRWPRR